MKSLPFLFFLIGFAILELVFITSVDKPLSEYLRTVDAQHPDVINFFRAYTDLGKSKWYLILSGIGILFCALAYRLTSFQKIHAQLRRYGQALLFFFVSVAISGIITDIIKPILGRARPVMLERENIYGFHPFSFHAAWNSMPSGHATTAFTIAAIFAYFFPRGQILWFLCAVILAASRVMVNAHYLSDVFAGTFVGLGTVFLFSHVLYHNVTYHIVCSIFPIDKKTPTP